MNIKTWFINPSENRFRAFWRLVGQTIFLALISSLLEVLLFAFYAGTADGKSGVSLVEALNTHANLLALNEIFTLVAILSSVWLGAKWLDHQPVSAFGLQINADWWSDLRFGLLLGAGLMTTLFLVEWVAGLITVTTTFYVNGNWPFLVALVFPIVQAIAAGVGEELLVRGYYLTNLAQGFRGGLGARGGSLAALLISACLFGVFHAMNPHATVFSVINITVAGIFLLGFGYLVTGSLALPIGVHITWNFFQGSVFGFPVSGTGMNNVSFLAIQQQGSSFLTGGSFGPEGGALGLMLMLLAAAIIALRVYLQKKKITIYTTIAVYLPKQ